MEEKYIPMNKFEVGNCYNLKEPGKEFLGPIYLGKYIRDGKLGNDDKNRNASRNFEKPSIHYFENRFVIKELDYATAKNKYAETTCQTQGGRRKSRRGRRRTTKTRSKRKLFS